MYYYNSKVNCKACAEYLFDIPSYEECYQCKQKQLKPVEIIKMGVGLFGNKAVVKFKDSGNLRTVEISNLREVKDNESI